MATGITQVERETGEANAPLAEVVEMDQCWDAQGEFGLYLTMRVRVCLGAV